MLNWGLGSFKAMSSMTLRSLALLGIYHRQLGTWDGKETASSSRLAFVFLFDTPCCLHISLSSRPFHADCACISAARTRIYARYMTVHIRFVQNSLICQEGIPLRGPLDLPRSLITWSE